jgi:pimeloyl-ACP methyl ester carboxylesterase
VLATQDDVQLIGGPRLSVRGGEGPLRPFLLVHDSGADSTAWDAVGERLVAAGHTVAAVDLRGHGRSEVTASGYDTDTCADDLSTLLEQLGFTGGRSAVVAGHGWGANVVLSLAARRDGVAAVACVAGGWTRPAWRYPTAEAAWAALGLAGEPEPLRSRRASIARSVFLGEPRAWYPLVGVPVALCPVVPRDGEPDPTGAGSATRTGIAEATARLPRARVSWYYGGDDVLVGTAARLTDDLLALATAAEPAVN